MKFKQGEVIREFQVEGKKVKFRYPKMEDLKDLQVLINSLVDEGARVSSVKKADHKQEIKWLKTTLKRMKQGLEINLFVEIDGKVVGNCSVAKNLEPPSPIDHVVTFGIILKKEYRELGLGTQMAETLFGLAKEMDAKIIRSSYFSDNLASAKLHEKLGFKNCGKIPNGGKFGDLYLDEILVYKEMS